MGNYNKESSYQRIPTSEDGVGPLSAGTDTAESQGHSYSQQLRRWRRALIDGLLMVVLILLAGWSILRELHLHRKGTFEGGYDTELELALSSIRVSRVRFTGGIKFHDNGTMFRDHGPGLQYIGTPNSEIDANWAALIGTRYLAFTEAQKSSFQVDMTQDESTGLYKAGPDVFHSLHCVNKLRTTIEGYQYNIPEKVDVSPENVMHIEHCLDFLRQLVQCNSDLTPIPLVYSKGAGLAIPDFEQVHTCREFDPIKHWASEQNKEALKHGWNRQ